MASRQQIKRRIGSVKNTKQITRAMQLVAASKLRKAQDAVGKPRAYAELAREILTTLRVEANGEKFRLFEPRPVKRRLIIVITSDRGLAGAYNSNVIRRMLSEVQADRAKGVQTSIVCVGRQVAHAASRVAGLDVQAVYQELPDHPDADSLRPILTSVAALFSEEKVDQVQIMYTKFISAVVQQVQLQQLLPAGFDEVAVPSELKHAEVEPSLDALVEFATLRLLESQIYQALLDAIASEQSMRMLAMKSATDNASALVDDLTLAYNNARQAAITQELAEITGGAEAMK
jgi:F-type H+-transporting ATPase subunit gamma